MDNLILQIESVKKSFVRNIRNIRGKEEDERFFVLEDVTMMIARRKIIALIGGNGAGKTALFNIISGFTKADSGEILYSSMKEDKPITLNKLPPNKIAGVGIGRLFQDDHIFPNMSIINNLLIADSNKYGEFPLTSIIQIKRSKSEEQDRIEKARIILMDLFGKRNPLWEKRDNFAGGLSYGQKRLLGLARLLMGNYDLLLLDEPTAGVNPQVIEQIMRIIVRLVSEKEMTIFLIEHNMGVVLRIADFCSFMSHGKITAFGTPEDVIGNDEVRRTYLGM